MNVSKKFSAWIFLLAWLAAVFPALSQTVTYTVASQYGAEKVSPTVGIKVGAPGNVTFSAPPFIYLNKKFQELDALDVYPANPPNPDDSIAHYRVKLIGATVDNTPNTQVTNGVFSTTVTNNMKVEWIWELEYAVFIDSATPATVGNGAGFGSPNPVVGRHFYPKNTEFKAAVDTRINNETGGFRFASKGYRLENLDGPSLAQPGDNYSKILETAGAAGNSLSLQGGGTVPNEKSATISFWGKVDRRLPISRDQVFFSFTNSNSNDGSNRFWGPLANRNDEMRSAGMSIGIRASGQFFVEEVVPTALAGNGYFQGNSREATVIEMASLPAGLVGLDWNYWTIKLRQTGSGANEVVTIEILRNLVPVFSRDISTGLGNANNNLGAIFISETFVTPFGNITLNALDSWLIGARRYSTAAEPASIPEENLEGSINDFALWERNPTDLELRSHAEGLGGTGVRVERPDFGTNFGPTLPFPGSARQALKAAEKTVSFDPTPASSRVQTESVTLSDWLRVTWLWKGQVRYRFDAAKTDTTGNVVQMLGQSFIRVYDAAGVVPGPLKIGQGANTDEWIDTGRKVEVGAFYRTTDNRMTLADFVAAPGGDVQATDTSGIGIGVSVDNLLDSANHSGTGRLARIRTITEATAPTEIHWTFKPTVYRAEVALGQSFDPKAAGQLVPPLNSGDVLRATASGPAASFTAVGPEASGVPPVVPARWDQVAKRLHPVYPGSYQVDWPDQSNGQTYRVEIVTGFPGATVPLATSRENPNGTRQAGQPGPFPYIKSVTFPNLTGFPAADLSTRQAHYRHFLTSSPARQPPTRLDLSATDEWFCKELTFSEPTVEGSVQGSDRTKPFTAKKEGRSVVLFSYRPNRDEVADGTPEREALAVRIVRSEISEPISIASQPDRLILGNRTLELGHGAPAQSGAVGVIQTGTASATPLGDNFVVDFWLDAKDLRKNATGVVKVFSIGSSPLEVVLDRTARTVTAKHRGQSVVHELPGSGARWHHYAVQILTTPMPLGQAKLLAFYQDGVLRKTGGLGALTGSPVQLQIDTSLTPQSLAFGSGASPLDLVRIDNFRVFKLSTSAGGELTVTERAALRQNRDPGLRGGQKLLRFDFETPSGGTAAAPFANLGTLVSVSVGPAPANPLIPGGALVLANVQEVATRIESTFDDAGFGGDGYVLNAVSNYNASLHQRNAEVGTWGPVFPVNHGRLFTQADRKLEIAYYENPYLQDRNAHPNVAWPYIAASYDQVVYPESGPHRRKALYIASRVGSEGVDRDGHLQQVFDLESYAGLTIYNQPSKDAAGYNPNEEHAIAAGANRAALKVKNLGEDIPNNPPLAAFALQNDINVTAETGYTSDPWVLMQVNNLVTGEPEMAAYRVFKDRTGVIPFPRPPDAVVSSTPGLAYEPAPNPEDRFLTLDATKTYDFGYTFEYPAFAGDLIIPPYPLNLVIGSATMVDARGGNLEDAAGNPRRAFWRDVNLNAWIIAGDGKFFHQFFYPFRGDFFLPGAVPAGSPVAWLPESPASFVGNNRYAGAEDDVPRPVKVRYNTFWRTTYPKLKRGETLTYQGGEYFNETPGSNGLPALVAMAAAEVVYDSGTPGMIFDDTILPTQSARIVRPLDRLEAPFTVANMQAAGFAPAATTKIFIVAERWYFKELPGSLQKRFYFDSLTEKIVFRGLLNDKESGDPDLTVGPDPLNVLEPNRITADEKSLMMGIGTGSDWTTAVTKVFDLSQNPSGVTSPNAPNVPTTGKYLQGMINAPERVTSNEVQIIRAREINTIYQRFNRDDLVVQLPPPNPSEYAHLSSFGAGSALVPNPNLLTSPVTGSSYVTIAENNRTELSGAPVSLHIIEIIPDRYRGAVKVIEGADAFSEKITLQHNGDFGANTGDLYYEWWIRDAAPLDVVAAEVLADGTLKEVGPGGESLWQQYLPQSRVADGNLTDFQKHLGLHTIVFEGRPDVVLADKLILVRYRHKNETKGWTLVPFEVANSGVAWEPGGSTVNAPFQWAGAANSPQLQADGSKRYVPQLVMGWVKRILDRINPYEARYTDFFGTESPATYSSQIQIAGAPFAGKVALNPDKNVIENTGLIELYETVLQRARELSIDNSTNAVSTDAINQALLLAATRLSTLYGLLGGEAYSDAQDPTIVVDSARGVDLASAASFTHAFQGLESDVLHEELALLRGTDFRKSFPVYNRMFWNYTKSLGEAAYNVNYNVSDENTDGFINEDDARALYPQGHGDAWGHYLSSLSMHYELLRQPVFVWRSRSELYSLMQNVLEVDFLDEKTFARTAAAKARAGRDIVRSTYRLHYTKDPDGQWQGYTDGADPARAWGVSEWAQRAGQAAYFDWAVANAVLPADAADATPVEDPENLDFLERSAAKDEIGEVAAGMFEIQSAMDEANQGVNPLGFDSNAIAFDIDPTFLAVGSTSQIGTRAVQGLTHFEQIFERSIIASKNALNTLNFATKAENKLRRIADDADALIVESLRQDLDYRNRLIAIFGRPYDGTIGFGKVYPEGYQGPDTLLYAYLDKVKINQIVPGNESNLPSEVTFSSVNKKALGAMNNINMITLYNNALGAAGPGNLATAFKTLIGDSVYQGETSSGVPFTARYDTASKYGFQAEPTWGTRTSYGKAQRALEEMLIAEISLDAAIADYIGYLQDWEAKTDRLLRELELFSRRDSLGIQIQATRATFNVIRTTIETFIAGFTIAKDVADEVAGAIREAFPLSVGLANDATSVPRALAVGAGAAAEESFSAKQLVEKLVLLGLEIVRDETIAGFERDITRIEQVSEFEGRIEELVNLSGGDQPKRDTIGRAAHELELKKQEYITALSEGFRLLRERESFNKVLASKVQTNRYQDMIFRLTRNEAMSKYQSAFNNAARYTWLAARAYDYETSLDPGHPAAATQLFDQIVKSRTLGLWSEGLPQIGQGGLGEILAILNLNYLAIEGQIGLNSVQIANENISMRKEHFRIGPGLDGGGTVQSDMRWTDALKARIVPDLWTVPEFKEHCRPFADPSAGPQPGLVIRFRSTIEPGLNFFGQPLGAGDHAYSSSQFATRIAAAGVFLEGYTDAGLAATPRAYLVPVGSDYFRVSTSSTPVTRMWTVRDTRIPTPFVSNQSQITSPGFIPSLDGVDGLFGEIRRHADFRMYANSSQVLDDDEQSTRLIARSIWNSEWILVIPGAGLSADPDDGLTKFTEHVSDIQLNFKTYSHNGQ